MTYRLGAMKPETTIEDTVTADELAKQVALDKVSRRFHLLGTLFSHGHAGCFGCQADLLYIVRFPLRKHLLVGLSERSRDHPSNALVRQCNN